MGYLVRGKGSTFHDLEPLSFVPFLSPHSESEALKYLAMEINDGQNSLGLVRIIGNVEGQADNQFSQPRGIALCSRTKTLFVVDNNNHRVQVFDLRSLAYIRTIASSSQSSPFFASMGRILNSPVGCCLDREGQLFVSDTNNHRIAVFDQNSGELLRTISQQGSLSGFLNCPYGVCVDNEEGVLYVADYHNHRIQAFDKDTGAFMRVFGSSRSDNFNGEGNGTQSEEGAGGETRALLEEEEIKPGAGPGQFNEPIAVALDNENGRLLVADFSNNRIQVLNKTTGTFLCQIGGGLSNEFRGPRGLAVDRGSKLLFVSDRENHRIKIYNKDSYSLLRTFGAQGTEPMTFNRPIELCVCVEEGVLLVVDGYNHRVQVIEVEELQETKMRLAQRNKVRAEEETRLRKLPKASKTAHSIDLSLAERIEAPNRRQILRFRDLGPLYDLEVPQEKGSVGGLPASREECDGSNKGKLGGTPIARERNTPATHLSPKMTQSMDRHAASFLAVINSVYDDLKSLITAESSIQAVLQSEESESLGLIVPPALALYSLIERKWTPEPSEIPDGVIKCLGFVLSSVQAVTVSQEEKDQVVAAVIAFLRLSAQSGPEVTQKVFSCMLDNLKRLQEQSLSSRNLLTPPTSQANLAAPSQQHQLEEIVMVQDQQKEAYLTTLQLVYDVLLVESSSYDHHRYRTQPLYHREVTRLIFGSAFVGAMAGGSSSKSTRLDGDEGNTLKGNSSLKSDKLARLPEGFNTLIESVYLLKRARQMHLGDSALSLKVLKQAQEYFALLQSAAIEASVGEAEPVRKMQRGGRHIWREGEPMRVGDLVDAMDKEKCWFESYIVELRPGMNVKVHFMGWGSKWDDVISINDLPHRVAPLNTMTKDWRADLFEGGLIEIKCNEDTVYQKWMWGRIIAMSVTEEWVDVSYSFSNEPPVLKRAALYGETICPVGMHTKDRSKAVMATIVRPPKKAEELVVKKEESMDDTAFYDKDDELLIRGGDLDDEFTYLDADLSLSTVNAPSTVGTESESPAYMDPNPAGYITPGDLTTGSTPANTTPRRGGGGGSHPGSPYLQRRLSLGGGFTSSSTRDIPGSGSTVGTAASGPAMAAHMPSLQRQNSSSSSKGFSALVEHDQDAFPEVLDQIARIVFEGVMAEVVGAVTRPIVGDAKAAENALLRMPGSPELVDSADSKNSIGKQSHINMEQSHFTVALDVLRVLAHGPFKRLLAPYFCRVIIVHCGLRAKILASNYLATCPNSVQSASDFITPSEVLQQIRTYENIYSRLLVRCLGDHLSMAVTRRVLLKVQATARQCGVTPLASNFTKQLGRSSAPGLRQIFIIDLLQNEQRFNGDPSALRSILLNLLPVASDADMRAISCTWVDILTSWVEDTCCEYAETHSECMHIPFDSVAFDLRSLRTSRYAWSGLLDKLLDMLSKARSVSRLELHEAERCHMAAETAFYRAFSRLPEHVLVGVSKMIAVHLAFLLDDDSPRPLHFTSTKSSDIVPGGNDNELTVSGRAEPLSMQSTITKSIDRLVELVDVAMSGDTSRYFKEYYCALLAVRLLHGGCSINAERVVLQSLPHMPQAFLLLRDMEIAGSYTLDFKKFLMNRIDDGEITFSNQVIDLVFQSTGSYLGINVIPAATWPVHSTHLHSFCNLKLPADLASIAEEFELFYASLPSVWAAERVEVIQNKHKYKHSRRLASGASVDSAAGSGGDEATSISNSPHISQRDELMSPIASGGDDSGSGRSTSVVTPSEDFSDNRAISPFSSLVHSTDRSSPYSRADVNFASSEPPEIGLDFLGLTLDQAVSPQRIQSPKRLSWCHGSGSVTLELRQGQQLRHTLVVNEPMAAVLMLFNSVSSATSTLSRKALREGTSLDDDMLSVVLADLTSYRPPLLEKTMSGEEEEYRVSRTALHAPSSGTESIELSKSFYYRSPRNRLYAAKMGYLDQQWAYQKVDAVIVRVLKAEPSGKSSSTELCEKVVRYMRTLNGKRLVNSATILMRCDHLERRGLLVKRRSTVDCADTVEYIHHLSTAPVSVNSCGSNASEDASKGSSSLDSSPSDSQQGETNSGPRDAAIEGNSALFRRLCSALKLSKNLSITADEFIAGWFQWIMRENVSEASALLSWRWASRPGNPYPPFSDLYRDSNTKRVRAARNKSSPFDSSSATAASARVNVESHHVTAGQPGDDPAVRSCLIAASLALGMGVSQLAKLEYLLRRDVEGKVQYTLADATPWSSRLSVIREVARYKEAIEETIFSLMCSPSEQETLGIHKTVAKLLPCELKSCALRLLSCISVATEKSQGKPSSTHSSSAKRYKQSLSDEVDMVWNEGRVGSVAALNDLVNRGFVSPDFALALTSLSVDTNQGTSVLGDASVGFLAQSKVPVSDSPPGKIVDEAKAKVDQEDKEEGQELPPANEKTTFTVSLRSVYMACMRFETCSISDWDASRGSDRNSRFSASPHSRPFTPEHKDSVAESASLNKDAYPTRKATHSSPGSSSGGSVGRKRSNRKSRGSFSAASGPASVAALAQTRDKLLASAETVSPPAAPLGYGSAPSSLFGMNLMPAAEGDSSNMLGTGGAAAAANMPPPIPSQGSWPYDGSESARLPLASRLEAPSPPLAFGDIDAEAQHSMTAGLNSFRFVAHQHGVTGNSPSLSLGSVGVGMAPKDTMEIRLEALIMEANRRFRASFHVEFLSNLTDTVSQDGSSHTESAVSPSEARIEGNEVKEISNTELSSTNSSSSTSLEAHPGAPALHLACKDLINRLARMVASSHSIIDDASYEGTDGDRAEMKRAAPVSCASPDVLTLKYHSSLDAMLTAFFTSTAKESALTAAAFEGVSLSSSSTTTSQQGGANISSSLPSPDTTQDITHEVQRLAKILGVSWPGMTSIYGNPAEINLWNKPLKDSTARNERTLQVLLAKVALVSQATALDGIASLHLLSRPEASWDVDECLNSYFKSQSSLDTNTKHDAIFRGCDVGITWGPPSPHACSSLYSDCKDSAAEGPDGFSIRCSKCEKTEKTDLFSLSCMHWFCRTCWEVSLRGQLEAKQSKSLSCPCCAEVVPPTFTVRVFTTTAKDISAIDAFFVKAFAEAFKLWYRSECVHVASDISRHKPGDGEQKAVLSATATNEPDGAINDSGTGVDLMPLTPEGVRVRRGGDASSTAAIAATAGAAAAYAAMSTCGPDERGSRWRSLLSLVSSSYQLPAAAQAQNIQAFQATQEASTSVISPLGTDGRRFFSRGTPHAGSTAGAVPKPGSAGVAKLTFFHLHEKFSSQHRSLLYKEGSVLSDTKALATLRLKLDACDILAKASLTLHRSHQVNWTTSSTPFAKLKRSTQSSPSWAVASEGLTTSAMVLLEPLRLYVTALSKAMETILVQSHLEGSALETLRQLLHAVRIHQASVSRILALAWLRPPTPKTGVGKSAPALRQTDTSRAGGFDCNLDEAFGSNPFSVFVI